MFHNHSRLCECETCAEFKRTNRQMYKCLGMYYLIVIAVMVSLGMCSGSN